MKKIVLSLLFTVFIIGFIEQEQKVEANTVDEFMEEQQSQKQEKLLTKLEKELSKMDLSLESLSETGDMYFDGDQMILQIANSTASKKDQKRFEKLGRITKKLAQSSPTEIKVVATKYTSKELIDMQNNFESKANELGLTDKYKLSLNSEFNRLELVIESLSEQSTKELQSLYGEALSIKVDANISEKMESEFQAFKPRKSDFNSQGGGIGIKTTTATSGSYYNCTTAGVAQKGANTWVMSAGHCAQHSDTFYQWNSSSPLGYTHLNATASDYDFLLIKVSGSPLKRYATNGLYNDTADTSTGYDGSLTGSIEQYQGMQVCKVGITTNRTCGVVTVKRERAGSIFNNGAVYFVVENNGAVISKGGDSGAPWFTQSRPYRLVGIHSRGLPTGDSTRAFATPWTEVADKYGLSLYSGSASLPMN
ncbi:S1 family peptidase [Planococcus sp. NCCP-2050]|uniref:S1 family peptidase n=1 Tax=Planococcus sp. NCCP-2050 TaxID=2944679 RepID=UPI0020410E0E|nr:trypsin-like serine protease [Planococcus sp. NCCP-2050]GKW46907.1 hypothetical protein NCCP2050_25990 [Planococcus sp. NCCP-2050]